MVAMHKFVANAEPRARALAIEPSSERPMSVEFAALDVALSEYETGVRKNEETSVALRSEAALFEGSEQQVVHLVRFIEEQCVRAAEAERARNRSWRRIQTIPANFRSRLLRARMRHTELESRCLGSGERALEHMRELFSKSGRLADFEGLVAGAKFAARPRHDRLLRELAQR